MRKIIYCNHADTFLGFPKKLRDELVEFQQNGPCRAIKEALGYRVMTALGRKYKHY